ncbi:restriction endonuclease subunit S [Aestuariirhabdus sp. Z084]|uniref:restriction endonuclease subunit S n=1 Tax=Aestuariirhabdus haliotis TaxID=2918751 RepID=UPI0020C13FEE|nr:restriction endonuclease subunit S [Aestuariirhabdus haliotis]MCL6416025.1 restriction endonuclease subunit S [Aestuariirhabdus haliotis]
MSYKLPFSEIAEVVMGQSPTKENVNTEGMGTPLLNGPTEFTARNPIPVQYTTTGKKFSKPSDILFCVRGSTTGRMNYSDQEYAIGRGIAAIRGKGGYPTPYVRAVIEHNLDRLLVAATGSTFPNVGRDLLSNFEVEVITPEEAVLASNLIEALEDKVESNRQTNQTLEQIAQALFKSWFVDFDPVKEKIAVLEAGGTTEEAELAAMSMIAAKSSEQLAELKQSKPDAYEQLAQTAALFPSAMQESELGEIPEGWSTPTLKSLSDKISKGTTPRKPDLVNASDQAIIPFIKVKDISDDSEINRVSLEAIPASIHEKTLKRSILTSDDLLFSIAGTIGRVSIVDEDLNNSNTNQAVAFVRLLDKEGFLELVYLTLKSSRVQGEIASKVVQGVQANASLANIGDIKIMCPDNDLLGAWKKIVHPIIKERRTLSKLIRELVALRDGVLPKLLSGELQGK